MTRYMARYNIEGIVWLQSDFVGGYAQLFVENVGSSVGYFQNFALFGALQSTCQVLLECLCRK